jgi:hypothetical protein
MAVSACRPMLVMKGAYVRYSAVRMTIRNMPCRNNSTPVSVSRFAFPRISLLCYPGGGDSVACSYPAMLRGSEYFVTRLVLTGAKSRCRGTVERCPDIVHRCHPRPDTPSPASGSVIRPCDPGPGRHCCVVCGAGGRRPGGVRRRRRGRWCGHVPGVPRCRRSAGRHTPRSRMITWVDHESVVVWCVASTSTASSGRNGRGQRDIAHHGPCSLLVKPAGRCGDVRVALRGRGCSAPGRTAPVRTVPRWCRGS